MKRHSRIELKPDVRLAENAKRSATRASRIATTVFEVVFTVEVIHSDQILKVKHPSVDIHLFQFKVENNRHGIQILGLGKCSH
jgi:hypothetical protein